MADRRLAGVTTGIERQLAGVTAGLDAAMELAGVMDGLSAAMDSSGVGELGVGCRGPGMMYSGVAASASGAARMAALGASGVPITGWTAGESFSGSCSSSPKTSPSEVETSSDGMSGCNSFSFSTIAIEHNDELSFTTLEGETSSSDPILRFISGILGWRDPLELHEPSEHIELKLVLVLKKSGCLYTGTALMAESPDPSSIALVSWSSMAEFSSCRSEDLVSSNPPVQDSSVVVPDTSCRAGAVTKVDVALALSPKLLGVSTESLSLCLLAALAWH